MEDYSPTPDEVEETPLKKRRFLKGNFLRSWLEHRDETEDSSSTVGPEVNEEAPEDWRPQRLSDRLRQVFDNLVNMEVVPEAEPARSYEDRAEEAQADSQELPQEEDEDFEGLLAVSPDAQMRYHGYEAMDEPGLEEEEAVAPKPLRHPLDAAPITAVDSYDHGRGPARSQTSSEQGSRSAEPIGEVLRRRKAERLEKRVKRLKKQSRTLRREQAELKDKQKEFEKELAEKQKAQEKFEKVTVPNMEKARQRLQQRLEAQPQVAGQEVNSKLSEKVPPKVEVKSEAKTEVNARPEVIYEYSRPKVELPAQEIEKAKEREEAPQIVRERDFERKHEVKDQAGTTKSLYGTATGPTYSRLASRATYNSSSHVRAMPFSNPESINNPPSYPPGSSMYKQAVKTGFWSGLGLTVILLLVLMLMQ